MQVSLAQNSKLIKVKSPTVQSKLGMHTTAGFGLVFLFDFVFIVNVFSKALSI